MKLGFKEYLILLLISIVGLLAGVLIAQRPQQESIVYQQPADDGKLAKTYKEENLVTKIRSKGKEIQTCYFDYLATSPETKEGIVKILFKIEEDGLIGKMQVTDNEFKNSKLSDCILEKLDRVYLSPPPLGINRFISHEIAFKLEETAIREAQERELKNQPPKVLPVK